MSKILITFLGKAKSNFQDYEEVPYRFDDMPDPYEEQTHFGFVLKNHLFSDSPGKTVFLGTQTSMWDALFQDTDGNTPSKYREVRNQLSKLINENTKLPVNSEKDITQESMWSELKEFLNEYHSGAMVGVIDYGQDLDGQIRILRQVAEFVNEGDQVYLDITHGFRHLPLLAVLIALYLEHIKKVEIKGIYYGAFELWGKDGGDYAPVLELKGLLRIAKWLGALKQFEKDGDYSVFSGLLRRDGLSKDVTEKLEKAAFYERNLNVSGARQELTGVYNKLDDLTDLGELFRDSLQQKLEWHRAGDTNPYARQRKLAAFYLENRDYLRAIIFAFEAYISKNMTGDYYDYSARDNAKRTFESVPYAQRDSNYTKLKTLRNLLAHGSFEDDDSNMGRAKKDTRDEILSWVKSEEKLSVELKALMKKLFSS
jgi:CRISPR-associated Csx2 family protein